MPIDLFAPGGDKCQFRPGPVVSFQLYEDTSAVDAEGPFATYGVEVHDNAKIADSDQPEDLIDEAHRQGRVFERVEASTADLCKEAGLTPASVSKVTRSAKYQVRSADEKKEVPSPFYELIYVIRTKEFTYLVARFEGPLRRDRIEATLQFDSICPSTPSIDPNDAKHKSKSPGEAGGVARTARAAPP